MTDQNQRPGTETNDRQRVVGETDHPQHRAPSGEGMRAPLAEDGGGPPQTSIFDGKGNESVVALADDENGMARQGTGPDLQSALSDAKNPKTPIGEAYSPEEPDRGGSSTGR